LSGSFRKPTIWKLLNVEEEISNLDRKYGDVARFISQAITLEIQKVSILRKN
jgi:hypothetical protein